MTSPHLYCVILLAIQVAFVHAQTQVNCPPGQVFVSQSCKPCPAGTYRVVNTTNTCIKCPLGTSNPVVGAASKFLCFSCLPNTFTDSKGSSRCKKCPHGTVANDRASRCQACAPGFWLRGDTCQPCEEGEFNPKNATLICQLCPFPLTSPRQATSRSQCTTCPPGRFDGGCRTCLEGTFKPGRRGRCRHCPPGSVSSPGSVECTQCPAGTFSGRMFQDRCRLCPEGTTSNGPGATRCRPVRSTRCPSRTFENANGDCERCRFDFRYNKESRMCEPCKSGFVSRGGLQTECKKCPVGQTSGGDELGCLCPPGMFKRGDTCQPCPPGTEGLNGGDCSPCLAGTFSNRPGLARCEPCPLGTFSDDEEGATNCKRCPRGSVPNGLPRSFSIFDLHGSSRCLLISTGCPLGTQLERNAFDRLFCRRVDCVVGTPEKEIGITCMPCEPGFRLVEGRCKRCPRDAVSDGGVITSCRKCENGLLRSSADFSKCSCENKAGVRGIIQDGVCKSCPPGSIANRRSENCIECPPGSFASGLWNSFCTRCAPGTFADENGSEACKKCGKGLVPEKVMGSRECVPTA